MTDVNADSGLSRRGFLGAAVGAGVGMAIDPSDAVASDRPPPAGWPIAEPYPVLNGGAYSRPAVTASPDPLVRYRWDALRADDELQVYQLRPVAASTDAPASFGNLRSASTSHCDVSVRGVGSIRFDFGVESPAWLEFDSPDFTGDVEMSISEYNEPAIVNPGPAHPVKTLAPRRYGSTFRLELNADFYEGVRFGWIHVRTFDQPWHITAVRVVCQAKPANYAGRFACSDPLLNRIWYTGAYVVRAGFQRDYTAPILMDRGDRYGWAGDCNPIQSAALVAFGNAGYVKANLDRTVDAIFGIESYALYWILSLLEYYQHTADTATLRAYAGNVRAKLEHGNDVYADPPIVFFGWDERLGAGFEAAERLENKTAYRMLFIRACREFADAMDTIGQDDVGATYRQMAGQRVAELRSDPGWPAPLGIHALADAINAGCVPPDEQASIFHKEFADRLHRLSFSTFNQYFILQALAIIDRHDEALVTMRDNWGGQLAYGGTTFFEVFRPDWLRLIGPNDPVPNSQSGWTSLAHPWGGGATSWLSHEILGIRPTAPGFAEVDVFPQPGRTLTWVSGSVPTPHGEVSAELDVRSGRGKVILPPGSVGRVGIPKAGRVIDRVRVNGRLVWDGRFHQVPGVAGAHAERGVVILTGVEPGRYRLDVSYRGQRIAYRPTALKYPMRFRGQDATTGGDWGGTYGRDGHILFNYDGRGLHRSVMPGYIASVDPWVSGYAGWSNCRDAVWESRTADRRALAPDAANGLDRAAACLYSATPEPPGMTMAVDVTARPGAAFRLAMYFVDWDSTARQVAVEVFDLETRELVAAEQMVTGFHRGKYLILECDRSVRIRIAHVRGANAVLSGLLFDRQWNRAAVSGVSSGMPS